MSTGAIVALAVGGVVLVMVVSRPPAPPLPAYVNRKPATLGNLLLNTLTSTLDYVRGN